MVLQRTDQGAKAGSLRGRAKAQNHGPRGRVVSAYREKATGGGGAGGGLHWPAPTKLRARRSGGAGYTARPEGLNVGVG